MTQTSPRKFITGLLLAAGLAIAGSASAAAYSNMYVFGDSLSDTGRLAAATSDATVGYLWQIAARRPSAGANLPVGEYSLSPTY